MPSNSTADKFIDEYKQDLIKLLTLLASETNSQKVKDKADMLVEKLSKLDVDHPYMISYDPFSI